MTGESKPRPEDYSPSEVLGAAMLSGAQTVATGNLAAGPSVDTEEAIAGLFAEIVSEAKDEGDWQERALCAQTDPESFFPEKGASNRDAKRVCLLCEVRSECLDYAIQRDERFGIWGGLSERERRRLKKRST
jgi:WhiB family transcriptional regulator, redox-sensing transcriptional regulator